MSSVLPTSVVGIMEVIGYQATMQLVRALPGVDYLVPKGIQNGAQRDFLIETLGTAAATAFMSRYGGERLYIPACAKLLKAERNQLVVADYDSGVPVRQVALKYALSERQIWKILKRPVQLIGGEVPPEPEWMRAQMCLALDEPSPA